MAHIDTHPAPGPLSFVGSLALLYGAAFLPAAKLSAEALADLGLPGAWCVLMIALSFPALLLPSLPAPSRQRVLQSAGWARTLMAIPALATGLLLCQVAFAETYGSWTGVESYARAAFGIAAFVAGALLIFWDTPRD